MNPDRDKQLARFRANLHARVKEIIVNELGVEAEKVTPQASRNSSKGISIASMPS